MPTQTVTRSAESEIDSDQLYKFLSQPGNLPRWAPGFADAVESLDNNRYRVTKNGSTFLGEARHHPSALAVDYLRDIPGGRRAGAYLRVMPQPLGGSTIVITVPIPPDTTEAAVVLILDQELADIIRLAAF